MSVLASQIDAVSSSMPLRIVGQVEGIRGLTIEASDLPLPLGAMCRIHSYGGQTSLAEVIGFHEGYTLLMSLSPPRGMSRGDRVENLTSSPRIWCSEELLGRVLDGYGKPIDGKGELVLCQSRRIDGRGAPPLTRRNIDTPIATSIRAIDGLHTCGLGQRMGIFSGPGVGKSTLISGIARHSSADVSVIALVGERGREVQEFLVHTLGEQGLKRAVVVVSTSDDPPLLRVRAVKVAATVCEYFRDQGKNVLLLVDSLTRLCQAQRQIGLAAHEPPATKGYPPSVFSLLPEVLERAGRTERGSITGFYSVLVEGDDFNEPIADAVKGILDGHVWLSRSLANRGHFPAIDVLQSISRVRSDVTDKDHQRAARRVLNLLAVFQDIEDMVNIGAYVPGTNVDFDLAVQARPKINQYLQQEPNSPSTLEQSKRQLMELVAWIEQLEKALRAQAARSPGRGTAAAAGAR
ncbi:MAG TPA: FliI/YscN family ATPase [Tepidisphaeraceae bacterium]|nr:FliI/YscN family ATPase [Tepidisphaeraceae bacterium]